MSKIGSFILGFVMGAGTVIATTKFLSSESGREVQNRFREASDNLKDRVADYYDYADSTASDLKDGALNKWDEFSDRFHNDASDVKNNLVDNSVTDLEFDLAEDGTMHPTTKEDTSEFQQATNTDDQVGKAIDNVKNAVRDLR